MRRRISGLALAFIVLALGATGCRGTSCFDPTTLFLVVLGFLVIAVVGITLTRN